MRLKLPLGLLFGLLASSAVLCSVAWAQSAPLDTSARPVKDEHWSFEGPFGTYDRAALQRGFQVYKEVCSACHSLNRVAFHTLADEGGPGFTDAQMKAIAAACKLPGRSQR